MSKFSNPIPRSGLPNFHEASPLRSLRDADTVSRLWRKDRTNGKQVSALTNNVAQLQRAVMRLRPRSLAPAPLWHPFKVYTPPDKDCPDPTAIWRTFQVRSGYVGWRSIFASIFPSETYFEGNDEYALPAMQGGDFVGWFENDIITTFQSDYVRVKVPETVTVGNSGDFGASSGNSGIFVINPDSDDNDEIKVGFWSEITEAVDDAIGPFAQVKCRKYGSASGWNSSAWPTGSNIIPIAALQFFGKNSSSPNWPAQTWHTTQMAYDHVINRWPQGVGRYRGDWDVDSLSGQLFYPGDTVKDTTSGVNTKFWFHLTFKTETDAPIESADWMQLSKFT